MIVDPVPNDGVLPSIILGRQSRRLWKESEKTLALADTLCMAGNMEKREHSTIKATLNSAIANVCRIYDALLILEDTLKLPTVIPTNADPTALKMGSTMNMAIDLTQESDEDDDPISKRSV